MLETNTFATGNNYIWRWRRFHLLLESKVFRARNKHVKNTHLLHRVCNAWSKAAQIRGVGVDTRPTIESSSRFVHFCTTCIYTELSTFCAGGHTHVRLLGWLFLGGHTSSRHKPPMHNGCHHFTHPPTHYDTTNPHKLLGNPRPLPYEVSLTPRKSNSFLGKVCKTT